MNQDTLFGDLSELLWPLLDEEEVTIEELEAAFTNVIAGWKQDRILCAFCKKMKFADTAHLSTQDPDTIQVCDDCWDERLR